MNIKEKEFKYLRSHIGKEYITNEGYIAKVIDGGKKPRHCIIKIEDWISEVTSSQLTKGKVKYPYHPSVYGIGYFGVGKYKCEIKEKSVKSYHIWKGMLQRCYDPKYQLKKPTYIGCICCDEWLNYQNFAEWFCFNYKEIEIINFQLDKDLMIKGNKIYSPSTCKFIPDYANSFLANNKINNTSGYIGVTWREERKSYQVSITDVVTKKRIWLGQFKDLNEASKAYKDARRIQCLNVYNKLINDGVTDQDVLNKFKKGDL